MVKKIIYRAAIAAALTTGLGVAVLGVQVYTTLKQSDEVREVAIQQWLKDNPDGEDTVNRYRLACERAPAKDSLPSKPTKPLTLAECSAQAGSESLTAAIETAINSVEPPAPLRWL